MMAAAVAVVVVAVVLLLLVFPSAAEATNYSVQLSEAHLISILLGTLLPRFQVKIRMFKSGSDADDRAQCLCQCQALKNSGELFIITDSFLPPGRLINYEESLTTAAATTRNASSRIY